MAGVPLRKLVVLEEGALVALANGPAAAEFPVLAVLTNGGTTPKKSGCGSCNRASQARAQLFQKVKIAIAGMGGAQKRKLKELMHAQSVRILYKDSAGRPQQLTF